MIGSDFVRACSCCGDEFTIEIRAGRRPSSCPHCRYRCFDDAGRRRPGAFTRNLLISRPDRARKLATTKKAARVWRTVRGAA